MLNDLVAAEADVVESAYEGRDEGWPLVLEVGVGVSHDLFVKVDGEDLLLGEN